MTIPEESPSQRRNSLSEYKDRPRLLPFIRSTVITSASVYWLPVHRYPIPSYQRNWILEFLARVNSTFTAEQLLCENFLQLKHTRKELNQRFTQTLLEYEPITGILLGPGKSLPKAPTSLEIAKLVEKPDPQGEVDIEHLAPDYCAWFLQKKFAEQWKDFLGVGGTMTLWVKSDAENAPTPVRISKSLRTHPAFAGFDPDLQFRKLHSMQSPWLKQSKEVFGQAIREEASFQGLPFVLPRLNAAAFTAATPDELAAWFNVFHAYCIESMEDSGLVFAVGISDFDDTLQDILDKMAADKLEYR